MKVSLNSLRDFAERFNCAHGLTDIGVDRLVEKIGAQLGAVEEVIDIGSKYQSIVITKVVNCEQHPNADRLKVCTIDDGGNTPDVNRGEDGYVQVVCGAPNVREGLTVAWLPPGATVPETVGKESFVLETRELRGVVSNGMLASPKELALGYSHEGILEIDGEHQPGSDFAEAFGLKDDVVLDIENKMFTHRPDCFGFLGVARELAGIQGIPFTSPEWYSPEYAAKAFADQTGVLKQVQDDDILPLSLKNELPELVPRFTMVAMRDVQVGPSPVWLQVELAKVGARSINNIVDYTNFFMLETGQPLHAYDYDKVKALSGGAGATIVVRYPQSGEKIKLLNGKAIEPRAEAIMIATDKQAIGLGGVMGGADTEVDASTKHIILECANFDMYSVRRTSMAHGLFTDAVTRFNKGQSPLQNLAVLAKIADEIARYAGGKVASQLIDEQRIDKLFNDLTLYSPVQVSKQFINSRLGLDLSNETIMQLLQNVEFQVQLTSSRHSKLDLEPSQKSVAEGDSSSTGSQLAGRDNSEDSIKVQAPFWRTDIELPEDVVEEVGRLYGYNALPVVLPKRVIEPTRRDELLDIKARIRDRLSRAGANELLTYSFVHGDLLAKVGQDKAKAFQLSNALSPDLQYYRLSLTPSLLEKVHPNSKAGYDQFALFEIGKVHVVDEFAPSDPDVPTEFERVALVLATNAKAAKKSDGAAYYQALAYLKSLLALFGIEEALAFEPLDPERYSGSTTLKISQYEASRAATILLGDSVLGEIGEYKASVRKALKLPIYTAGFELDVSVLQSLVKGGPSYLSSFKYPGVKQDITLKVPADQTFQHVYEGVDKALGANAPDDSHIRLDPLDIFRRPNAQDHTHFSFRVTIHGLNRTLTEAAVSAVLDAIAEAVKETLGAERI